jgi:muramoyltetrapeptide carboxypeptidase LdcA involved in peptidoglycan recycling
MATAGIQVIGLGVGAARATFTFTTGATANIPVTAANVTFRNCIFIANFADIIWAGANGIVLQPKFRWKFAAEATLHYELEPKDRAINDEWKTLPRQWDENDGWRVLNAGSIEAPILAFNLNTMVSSAGTPYWPDFKGKILLIEDMEAPLGRTERTLRQLKFNGVFDQIVGLVVGKPEFYNQEGAPFGYEDLFKEIIGPCPYPIVSNFDCSHTVPMISVPQLSPVRLVAQQGKAVSFEFLDGAIQ